MVQIIIFHVFCFVQYKHDEANKIITIFYENNILDFFNQGYVCSSNNLCWCTKMHVSDDILKVVKNTVKFGKTNNLNIKVFSTAAKIMRSQFKKWKILMPIEFSDRSNEFYCQGYTYFSF